MSIKPATTGEIENGKSIIVISAVRALKRNRAISHAAATPNSVFSTTAIGATISVSLIECSVAGLLHQPVPVGPESIFQRQIKHQRHRRDNENADDHQRRANQQPAHQCRFVSGTATVV